MDQERLQRVKEVFSEARGLPAEELASALGRLCAGDADLELEVRAMLEADARAGEFLSESRLGSIAASVLSDGVGERIGSRVGPYQLLELIGEGGFGEVYLAEQVEPIRRRVALKVIKLGMDTRQVVARFEHERQALAMMDHPCIARVLDAGATPSGRPFFVMELVRGDPITTFCDARRLGVPERLALFRQVCSAVQHAHQKGIVHRDIKPSNVLVTLVDGERPMPKIIDFGIALATQGRLTERTMFTEFRQFVGTPEYMSPEQAGLGGDGGLDIDTRTDVYSLGVLLYELLTGATPFDAAALRTAAFEELRRIIREVDPPRPSARVSSMATRQECAARRGLDPPGLVSAVRGDLDWAVMRCLEKDRTRRYASPEDLGRDIDRFLRSEPLEAGPPTPWYRVRKFVLRHRAGVAAAGVLGGAIVLGIIATTWAALWALRERDLAMRSEASALRAWTRAEGSARAEADARREADRSAREAQLIAYRLSIGTAIRAMADGRTSLMREALAGAPAHLRGWEWRWLNWRADARVRRLDTPGNTDSVALAGAETIVRGSDGVIRVFETRTGGLVRSFSTRPGPATSPYALQIVEPASMLLMAHTDAPRGRWLSAWDLRTGALLWERPYTGHGGGSANGSRYIVPVPGGVALLDARTGREVETILLGPTPTMAMFRGDESLALLALANQEWQLWSLADRRMVGQYYAAESAFDGPWMHYLNTAGALLRFDTTRGVMEASGLGVDLRNSVLDSLGMNMISDRRGPGRLCAVDPYAGVTVGVINVPEGTRILRGHRDGRTQVSIDADGGVSVWDLAIGSQPFVPPIPIRGQYAGTVDEACERTATVGWGDVGVYDARTGENVWSAYPGRGGFYAAAFNPSSTLLAVGGSDDAVHILDGGTGRIRWRLPAPSGVVTALAWSPDGSRLLAGVQGGRVLAAPIGGSEPAWEQWPGEHDGAITSLRFSPDGTRVYLATSGRLSLTDFGQVASGTRDSLVVRDAATGRIVREIESAVGGVLALALSPDGEVIAVGGRSGVSLHGESDLREIARAGTETSIVAVAFAPDGTRLAAAGASGLIRLFDPEGLETVAELEAGAGYGYTARFSPDGERLLLASGRRPLIAFEAGPPPDPARRMLYQRAALAMDGVFEACCFVSERAAAIIEADPRLHEQVRRAAVEQARVRGDDPNRIVNAVILSLRVIGNDRDQAAMLAEAAEAAIRAAPETTAFHTWRAVSLERAGQHARAIDAAMRSIEAAPPDARRRLAISWAAVALARHHLGDHGGAADALRRALEQAATPAIAQDRDVDPLLRDALSAIGDPVPGGE